MRRTAHQDTASSHTVNKPIDVPDKPKVKFLIPAEWIPKSHDAAPMAYGLLKPRLQKRTIYTMTGLKKGAQIRMG